MSTECLLVCVKFSRVAEVVFRASTQDLQLKKAARSDDLLLGWLKYEVIVTVCEERDYDLPLTLLGGCLTAVVSVVCSGWPVMPQHTTYRLCHL